MKLICESMAFRTELAMHESDRGNDREKAEFPSSWNIGTFIHCVNLSDIKGQVIFCLSTNISDKLNFQFPCRNGVTYLMLNGFVVWASLAVKNSPVWCVRYSLPFLTLKFAPHFKDSVAVFSSRKVPVEMSSLRKTAFLNKSTVVIKYNM